MTAASMMNPPSLPATSMAILQYALTSSGVPVSSVLLGTLPIRHTVSPSTALALAMSVWAMW